MTSSSSSSRGLLGGIGAFLSVWLKLVLAVFGAVLMLFLVLAGLLVGAVMLLWGLVTGRKPQVVWFRRGPGGHAQGFGRDGRFGEAWRDPLAAFSPRPRPEAAKDVVDIEVREVPEEPPRALPSELPTKR
jgi:hypothetical protein